MSTAPLPLAVMKDKEINVRTKGILIAILLIAALLSMQTSAFAWDLDYSGPINSFTGDPIEEKTSSADTDRILMTSGVYYDRNDRVYVYDLGGSSGETVSANVVDGMIVTGGVEIEPSNGVNLRCTGLHSSPLVVTPSY